MEQETSTVVPMNEDIQQTQHIATHESTAVVQAPDGEIYHYVIPAEAGHVIPLDNSGVQTNATQYYEGEELIASALTDEDRKLAADLVDVHYKNHQTVITSSLDTTTTQYTVDTTAGDTTTQYTVDTTAGSESAVSGGYMQQETVEEVPEVLTHDDESAEYISKTLENLQNESTEQNEEDQEMEVANPENPSRIVYKSSDTGKATQEDQPTPGKKSLPHKKRMAAANKLSEDNEAAEPDSPGKTFYSCSKCGDLFTTLPELATHKKTAHTSKPKVPAKAAAPSFLCQICQDSCSSQMEFFEHLKSHYEPVSTKAEEDTMSADGDNEPGDDPGSDGEDPIVKTVYLTENADSMDYSDMGGSRAGKENKPKTGKSKSGNTQFPGFTIVKAEARAYACTKCSKSFRRLKGLENHMTTTHPKKEEMEEFSEPEDMMEGLRHVVNILPNDGGEDDKSNIVVRSWSPLGTTLIGAGQGSNNYMSSHHYTEVLDPNMTAQQYANFDSINVELGGGSSTDKTISVTLVPIHEASTENDIIAASSSDDWKGTVVLLEDDEPPKPKRAKKEKVPGEKYVKRKKGEKVPLVCEYCSREFKHKNTLVYHLRSHTGEKPHMCDVCGKSFFTTSALKVHSRIHLGQRPYPCELCGRAFRQWGDLKYHKMSIHSEIKGFQCEYCGKEFARKYSLVVHRRIHTGERNYQCEFCNKAFRASSYLQNHRRIHTGEKPHFCPVCNKLFRVRSDMKRHLNTHNVDPRDYLTISGNQTGAIVKKENVVTVEGTYEEEYQVEQVHRRRGGGKKGRPATQTRGASPPLSSDSSDEDDMEEVPAPEPVRSKRRGVHHEPIEVDYASNKEMYVWIPDN
uniref:Zinc finger protein 544 n=1 Tax=Cacopsylla melanoneura TaxID=428564 RepID=A0A8D8WP23_9HEMI